MPNNSEKIRPRLAKEELAFLAYALQLLEQLSELKLKEIEALPYELKRFARIVWFTGDPKAFKLWKPYRKYVLTEMRKDQDFCKVMLNAQHLRRRIEGLLEGRHFHSQERWRR